MKTRMFIVFFLSVFIAFSFVIKNKNFNYKKPPTSKPEIIIKSPKIENYVFGHLEYEKIISKVKEWEKKSPLLIDTNFYGKTNRNKDCFYFKISNETIKSKYKVLVTACIHGNEPWSTSTIMAYAGFILSEYKKDEKITKIIDSTEIYFVPVVSPDSYPFSRMVDGVDPNRDFPSLKNPNKKSTKSVQNLRDLFLKIKPDSVLSGHTFGRVFLVPWGDSKKENPNSKEYEKIASKMSSLANYRWIKTSQLYGKTINGTETDWYHRNGSFAMVMEFGTHQRKPKKEETKSEFERTKEAFLFFVEESVKIEVKN